MELISILFTGALKCTCLAKIRLLPAYDIENRLHETFTKLVGGTLIRNLLTPQKLSPH